MRSIHVVAGAMVVGVWIVGLNLVTVAQADGFGVGASYDNHQVKSMIATLQTAPAWSTRRDRLPPCCGADRG